MKIDNYTRLVREGLSYDGESNTNHPFTIMTKKYGEAYIQYLQAAYQAKDDMSDEEFCRINGDVPLSFLEKKVKTS